MQTGQPRPYAEERGKRCIENRNSIVSHHVVDVRPDGEVHDSQEAERTNPQQRNDEAAGQHQRGERHRHLRKIDSKGQKVELHPESWDRRDNHGGGSRHGDVVRLELTVIGLESKHMRYCKQQTADCAEDAIKALSERETTVRL